MRRLADALGLNDAERAAMLTAPRPSSICKPAFTGQAPRL
jgi:hypothetical protein